MSTLPTPTIPKSSIDMDGVTVEFRSLTRTEAFRANRLTEAVQKGTKEVDDVEDFVLSCGTDSTIQQAAEWRAAVGFAVATPLIDAIMELSGLKIIEVEDDADKTPEELAKTDPLAG